MAVARVAAGWLRLGGTRPSCPVLVWGGSSRTTWTVLLPGPAPLPGPTTLPRTHPLLQLLTEFRTGSRRIIRRLGREVQRPGTAPGRGSAPWRRTFTYGSLLLPSTLFTRLPSAAADSPPPPVLDLPRQSWRKRAKMWLAAASELLWTLCRLLRLLMTFCPVLLLYPITYCGSWATECWWSLVLTAVELSGPIFIKLGQWASTRRDVFPEACCTRLARLQRRVPPHSWHFTLQQMRKAFGPHWRKVFVKFDNDGNPVGSGCVAQVYKVWMAPEAIHEEEIVAEMLSALDDEDSVLEGLEVLGFGGLLSSSSSTEDQASPQHHLRDKQEDVQEPQAGAASDPPQEPEETMSPDTDDTPTLSLVEEWQDTDLKKTLPVEERPLEEVEGLVPVAVKVLHPGVQAAFRRDVRLLRACAWLVTLLCPPLQWLSLPQCLDEFTHTMAAQINLKTEADNLETFTENFRDVPYVRFPRPVWPYVTRKVLVETYEEGEHIADIISTSQDDSFKRRVAQMGVDALLKMVFVDNLVHSDLHPGNLLVQNSDSGEDQAVMVDVGGDTFVLALQPPPNPLRICFLDCGVVARLSPPNLGNIRAVFKQVVLGHGERVADLFLEHSQHACPDPDTFRTEMAQLVDTARHNTITLGQVDVGVLLQEVLSVLLRHRVRLESAFSAVVLAIFVLEGLGRALDPDMDILERARPVLVTGEVG